MNLSEDEIKDYLVHIIQTAYADAINSGNVVLEVLDVPSATMDHIEVQYCYDKYYNRVFIEYELSESIRKKQFDDRVILKINSYINSNFFYDTKIYPEIISYDDGVNERYDSISLLSPYTIGYWNCLHGHYEFLYSHQVFMANMSGLNIPTYSEEFLQEMDENFNANYKTNFEKFNSEAQRIRNKYKISSDQAPDKKIEDFALEVAKIYDKYSRKLSSKDKDKYFEECNKVNWNAEKVKEINKAFRIGAPIYSMIPQIMEDYKKIYKDFFGVELHDIANNTKRFYIIQH